MLETGLEFAAEVIVDSSNTASSYGSGGVEVFATPAMVALMENAAYNAVQEHLDEGHTTVGTAVNITHLRATPVDETVKATARLIQIEGRNLLFEVTAFDQNGVVGKGTHGRAIIDLQRFMAKLQ